MNSKKKRVAPLKRSGSAASASKNLESNIADSGVELLDDDLDKLFGSEGKSDSAGGFIDLDDWTLPIDDEVAFDSEPASVDYSETETMKIQTSPAEKLIRTKPAAALVALNNLDNGNEPFADKIQNLSGRSLNFEDTPAAEKKSQQEGSKVMKKGKDDVLTPEYLALIKPSVSKENADSTALPPIKLMFTSREYEEDPILNLRFSKRDMPAVSIKEMSKSMEFLSLTASLKVNEGKKFFTGGVVTAHMPLRKAGSLMTLTDLASEPCSVRVLLFGAAFEAYSKVGVGTIVLVINPKKGKPYKGRESLLVSDGKQMSVAGSSKDYGVCGSRTKAGGTCKMVVNLKICRYCSLHAIAQFKEQCVSKNLHSVAVGRGLFSDKKLEAKTDLWMSPANSSYALIPGKVNFAQVKKDRDTLSRLDNANSSESFEKSSVVRKQVGLTSVKRKFVDVECSPETSLSKRTIPSEQSKIVKISGFFDNLKTTPLFKQRMSAAKRRAIDFAKASGGITPNSERKPKQETESPAIKKTKDNVLTPEYLALMKEKPSDPKLLKAAEAIERDKNFDRLSIIEEIGEKLSQTTEVPVRAFRCLACEKNYFQMPLQCVRSNHKCKVVSATKRFFQCGGCKKRTTTLERLPTTECDKCKRWAWKKCGVAGERVCTNADKLSVRGLEEKFLGSVVTDANLSLLVPDDK